MNEAAGIVGTPNGFSAVKLTFLVKLLANGPGTSGCSSSSPSSKPSPLTMSVATSPTRSLRLVGKTSTKAWDTSGGPSPFLWFCTIFITELTKLLSITIPFLARISSRSCCNARMSALSLAIPASTSTSSSVSSFSASAEFFDPN